MWILFRDPMTIFNHLDRYIVDVIAEEDIQAYQRQLSEVVGGRAHDFHEDVYFIQPFFTSKDDVSYFVRKYKTWLKSPSQ